MLTGPDETGQPKESGTTLALSACVDDACALRKAGALPTAEASDFARALPIFLATDWSAHAETLFTGIAAAHAALVDDNGVGSDVLAERVASDLGLPWPEAAVAVDLVSDFPRGPQHIVPPFLAVRGRCFRDTRPRLREAAIVDCVLVHAVLGERQPSLLRAALVRELGVAAGERAWELVVVHAVAVVVTGWQREHVSVYRAEAMADDNAMLEWLGHEWRGMGKESPDGFAGRFAAAWREDHGE
jgi:hypothetical protein